MRVLHLTTFVQGGAGRAITSLATAQARAGHEVSLVTSCTGAPGYGNYPDYIDELTDAGVAVSAIDSLFDRRPEAHRMVADFLDDRLGDDARPDVLHAHAGMAGALALAAVRRSHRRVSVLQTMHGWGLSKTPAQAAADVDAMNAVDRVVVPALSSATLLSSLGVHARQLSVVPYGVEPTPAMEAPDTWVVAMRNWRRLGHLVACCVGTIGERKNQRLLVDSIARMPPDVVVQAVIVGDGPTQAIRDVALAHGIADRVHLVGYRPRARQLLREADLLVLPSRSEGQPFAVLEAFCDGVPAVVSDIPELAEMVEDGQTGWLVSPENPQALADALVRVARTPEARRSVAARARARYQEHFTVERMVAAYMAEYERTS